MKRFICLAVVLATIFTYGCAGDIKTEAAKISESADIGSILESAGAQMSSAFSELEKLTETAENGMFDLIGEVAAQETESVLSEEFSTNVNVGDRVSFQLYQIEPYYSTLIDWLDVSGDRQFDYICKCYIDAAHTQYLYLYITGDEFCDNISQQESVHALRYMLPLTIEADAVEADTLATNFAQTSGSAIAYRFVSVSGKATYDMAHAVAFADGQKDWLESYVTSVVRVEPISYTFHVLSGLATGYAIDYVICVCTLSDGSTMQMAVHIDDYNAHLNNGEDIVFDGELFSLDRVSGNTEAIDFDTPLTIYGYSEATYMVIEGSEYQTTLIFHCLGE